MPPRLPVAACAVLILLPLVAQAHLLHKQEATLRLDGEKGYLAAAIPAAAFSGVDDNADGRLTPHEIATHQDEIVRQFIHGFRITSPEGAGKMVFAWVTNPEDTASSSPYHDMSTRNVIIMAGAEFDAPPTSVTIDIDLFGDEPDEKSLTLRVRRGDRVERAVLRHDAPAHEFFTRR